MGFTFFMREQARLTPPDTAMTGGVGATVIAEADRPAAPVLEVDGLSVEFRLRDRVVRAVSDVSFQLHGGETLAILGESGCGKSTSARALVGLLPTPPAVTRGSVRLAGVDVLTLPPRRRRRLCGERLAMVFQDSLAALNPVFTVGFQLSEIFRVHRGLSRRDARAAAAEQLDRVGIGSARSRLDDYPHQFSGGMRQRVLIAMAVALEPDVLIADEPTSALDVTVQAQIMDLLASLKSETDTALILITHDLGVVAESAERVAVMYAGRIVETGPVAEVFSRPAHPYTAGLMRSQPQIGARRKLSPIPGAPPNLGLLPEGCAFRPRCPRAEPVCLSKRPELTRVTGSRASACHFAEELVSV